MMDINTDLTRGRVLSGKAFVNPQTRSASLGGYYGYYHSIRSGVGGILSGEGWTPTYPARPAPVDLSVFLDHIDRICDTGGDTGMMLCYDEISRFYGKDRLPIKVRRGVRKTISNLCRWGREVWRSRYAGGGRKVEGYVPSLYAFLKYSGNLAKAFDDDEHAEYARQGDMEDDCEHYMGFYTGPAPLKSFLRTHKPVRDYNKFFILHGTFFFELESGNMETASGRLAYDSDETWGIRFNAGALNGGIQGMEADITEFARAASEEEQVALTLQNASATALLLEEIEWFEPQRIPQEAVSPQAEVVASNPA